MPTGTSSCQIASSEGGEEHNDELPRIPVR